MESRKFKNEKIFIATSNKGKIKEISDLVRPYNIEVVSPEGYNIAAPEETGLTFKENADIKALYYSKITNLPAIADDSGLSIDALGGEPGVYSARWAVEEGDFDLAMQKIWQKLNELNLKTSSARFTCALSIAWLDGHLESFEGQIEGHLTFPPRGKNGFGYDPIFIPNGYDQTFGEMNYDQKSFISHRTIAFNKLVKHCL